MNAYITKRNILVISLALTILAFLSGLLEPFRLCGAMQRDCIHLNYIFFLAISPTLPLFLFSLITYFLPDRFFKAWYKFALVWTSLAMIAILLAPEYSNAFMFAVTKGSAAFSSSALFCVISIGILLFQLFKDQK